MVVLCLAALVCQCRNGQIGYHFQEKGSETWGELAVNLTGAQNSPGSGEIETPGYITIDKAFKGKKPHTTISLTRQGRAAFREYKKSLQKVLDDLPD